MEHKSLAAIPNEAILMQGIMIIGCAMNAREALDLQLHHFTNLVANTLTVTKQ